MKKLLLSTLILLISCAANANEVACFQTMTCANKVCSPVLPGWVYSYPLVPTQIFTFTRASYTIQQGFSNKPQCSYKGNLGNSYVLNGSLNYVPNYKGKWVNSQPFKHVNYWGCASNSSSDCLWTEK